MAAAGTINRDQIRRKPKPAASMAKIRKMGYEGERQRQITNGWYARGKYNAEGDWTPDLGLPDDVFVYLPMGAPFEREHYPDKGFLPLSDVPNKRAIAGKPTTGEFIIDPPDFDLLEQVMAAMRARADESIAAVEAELAEIAETLEDSASLTKGEAPALRKGRKELQRRIKLLKDPATFDAIGHYRAFVVERMNVLKAQMDPKQARQAELGREVGEWQEHLEDLEKTLGAAPSRGSASSSKTSTKSTPPDTES